MTEGARQHALEQIALRIVLMPTGAQEKALAAFRQYYDDVLQEYGTDTDQGRDWLEDAMADLRALVTMFRAGIEWSAPFVNPKQLGTLFTLAGSQVKVSGASDDAFDD